MHNSENLHDINAIIASCVARDIPTLHIDQNIGWLSRVRSDIDFTISQLEQLKSARKRAQDHRDKMNALASEIYHEDDLNRSRSDWLKVIFQRFGCNKDTANAICDIVMAKIARKKRQYRNQQICIKHSCGETVTALARQYKISRQQVYNVLSDKHRFKIIT